MKSIYGFLSFYKYTTMNVLILTPDRVGSTLLQRLITVYMNAHTFDQPVINLHELTNGIMKYYSPTFNQEVLGKFEDRTKWGYYQTLEEITELLQSVPHYKTTRLAHYHIKKRQDTIASQVPFYEYLNQNYYIISAQRDNLFEHGLSWCIVNESKKLNVYTHQEKIDAFANIYKNRITVDPMALTKYLDQYVDYLAWVDNHFDVTSYFKYDKDMSRLEEYILGLSIFNDQSSKKSWKDIFQLEFSDWNKCHYLISDLSGIGTQLISSVEQPKLTYDGKDIDVDNMQLQSLTKSEIPRSLSVVDQRFLKENIANYQKAHIAINELVENKVLVTPVPIKLQTMLEKKLLVKNFSQCVDVYNNWAEKKGVGTHYTEEGLQLTMKEEIKSWHASALLK